MREIKFRAWIKKDKVMCDVVKIDFEKKEVYVNIPTKESSIFASITYGYKFDDIELMQYTGLKDKNGKEIYEGDIVRLTDDFIKGIYEIIYDDMSACFYLKDYDDQEVMWYEEKCFEVLGNIYENPELLEVDE